MFIYQYIIVSELQTKEMVFEEKLKMLESLLGNVQAYLTLSTAFIGSASKYELLKLGDWNKLLDCFTARP